MYQALLRNAPDQEIARLVNFYDYLEIQPLGNNAFMLADEKHDMINSEEDSERDKPEDRKTWRTVQETGGCHL